MLILFSTQEVARIRKCLRRFFSRRNPKLWAWSEFIWCHMDSWKQWVGHFRRAVWIVPWVWFPFVLNLDCPRRGFHADFSITNIFYLDGLLIPLYTILGYFGRDWTFLAASATRPIVTSSEFDFSQSIRFFTEFRWSSSIVISKTCHVFLLWIEMSSTSTLTVSSSSNSSPKMWWFAEDHFDS